MAASCQTVEANGPTERYEGPATIPVAGDTAADGASLRAAFMVRLRLGGDMACAFERFVAGVCAGGRAVSSAWYPSIRGGKAAASRRGALSWSSTHGASSSTAPSAGSYGPACLQRADRGGYHTAGLPRHGLSAPATE